MRITLHSVPKSVAFLAIAAIAVAACVDVPDGVRAQFAGPGATERSNFRQGQHGQAPPVEDAPPPVSKSAETTLTNGDANALNTDAASPVDGVSNASDGGLQ